ncbi:MAG: LPS assembly lipoprotein LptE [Rhodoferax sp.]|nr:LPS assembly lipoprotein LptE [Rhodoferax sp.]
MTLPHLLTRRRLGVATLAALTLPTLPTLPGCGFQLRANQSYAFSRIAITPSPGSAIVQELRRSFGDTVQVLPPGAPLAQAQVVLNVPQEQRDKVVVGSNASGQVREFQLRLSVQFSLTTPQGQELLPSDRLALQRDFSYNETFALAKETEEALLFRDMQTDIVQQILRRLATVRLNP